MRHITWMVVGLLFIEALRFIIPIDRLANEVQLASASPWLYTGFKMLHHIHKQEKRERQ